MEKRWQDIYPKQFDCLWTRFQGYKDKRIDEITSYHDQSRPYIVFFFKNGYYYCLPLSSTYNKNSFEIRGSYLKPNELYMIKRPDFIGKRYNLTDIEQDRLINYCIEGYWNNILKWNDYEYNSFLMSLKKPHPGNIVSYFDSMEKFMLLKESNNFYLISSLSYPYKLNLINKRSFLKISFGNKMLYNSIINDKQLNKKIDFLENAYLFRYNGFKVITLYKENDILYCLNIINRKIIKIDYLTIYTLDNYVFLNKEEKKNYLENQNIKLPEVIDLLEYLNSNKLILKKD